MPEKLRFRAPSGAFVFCLCTLAVAMAAAASSYSPPFGKWVRLSPNPILSPRGDGFKSAGTFNPSVVMKNGKFAMLYRAQDRKGTSSLGYATSEDGIHFLRRPEPVMVSETPYEKGGGVEDPRLVKVGDTYYLTYTGYNNADGVGRGQKRCAALPGDIHRSDSLEKAGHYLPGLPRQVEREMDQIGSNRSGKDQWKVLDVFPRGRAGQG